MNSPARGGYTLLEVILATTISMVLLAALFATLKLHLTTAEWGPRTAEQAQLARAIGDQIRRDVAHLILPSQVQGATATIDPLSGEKQSSVRYSGLRGQRNWIEFYVDEPLGRSDRTLRTPIGISRVRYEVAPAPRGTSTSRNRGTWSLIRTQTPAEFATAWDSGRTDVKRWSRRDVLSDQIASLQFQYWSANRNAWVDAWEMASGRVPPPAIRVTFRLQAAPPAPGGLPGSRENAHTVVISVASKQLLDALDDAPGARVQ